MEPLPEGYCTGLDSYVHPCMGLGLSPRTNEFGSALLKGDTLRMWTSSDSGYAEPVTWSVAGISVSLTQARSRADSANLYGRSSDVLVKGDHVGSATVSAMHFDPPRSASSIIRVVDSSAITKVNLGAFPTTLQVGNPTNYMGWSLADAYGVQYRGSPDRWSITDSTVVRLERSASGELSVRGLKAGTAGVTASFVNVQATLQFTVTP